jgi:hypothetical protein
MNSKIIAPLVVVIALLAAGVAYLGYNLKEQKQVNKDMQELAALDKKEMENEYQQFAAQYSEMKTRINNDSIVEQLSREQQRTQQLLEELRQTKADDAATITRLKKELANARAMLQQYALQVDSLNRLNEQLMDENSRISGQLAQSNLQNRALTSSNTELSEKVAMASRLSATNIQLIPRTKKGKAKDNMKSGDYADVTFTISKNVTAPVGKRTIYVRLTTPSGQVVDGKGIFEYEGKQLVYSMKLDVDYNGQEMTRSLYKDIDWSITGGNYNVSIFADGNIIGNRNFTFKK